MSQRRLSLVVSNQCLNGTKLSRIPLRMLSATLPSSLQPFAKNLARLRARRPAVADAVEKLVEDLLEDGG